ncbi:TopA Topoisomerase IA [uncultured Caudovirales phage]|uniref:DNA topoisomerase n=1 Tax=uncultured Caudovirales phage TaxID=2100421 RepID=A0A6J5RY70_9CAUD|nr:TopA Topoisomerase IA [uncultured Caudovirales phage]
MKTLVIVESPSKGQKIQEYLGKDYIVLASKGHITDLAKGGKHGLGVDVDNNFKPKYVLSDDRLDIMDQLLAAAKKVDLILVASDPDREGEAIAWHLADRLADTGKPIKRMVFNKIKKDVIQKALKEVRDIDIDLFHSQEARRILDRLVGFMASPFLMNCVGPKLSAGRVQSVVTRMIIDREREIEAFIPEDFWTIQVNLQTQAKEKFATKYNTKITTQANADLAKNFLNKNEYVISEVLSDEEKKIPQPPLVTSTLQRLMSKNFGFDADRTMKAAQALYEGGYVSYIRTDSVRVGDEDIEAVRKWLTDNNHNVPKKANSFKNKDAAQDAHECIHPTDLSLLPGQNYAILDPDEKTVYETVWKCFVASQMTPAVYNTLAVTAHPKDEASAKVKAYGKALKDKGYLEIFGVDDMGSIDIPNLSVGDIVTLSGKSPIKVEKKSTQPPPRFSQDKLIKELVNKNIGRPATYADLLSKITTRSYVEKRGNVYHATDLGKKITDILVSYFTFMDYNYTASMEAKLDEIEKGKEDHINMLKKFYPSFKQELDKAYVNNGGILCDKCNSPMSVRTVKADSSKFLACSAYPRCRNTKNL